MLVRKMSLAQSTLIVWMISLAISGCGGNSGSPANRASDRTSQAEFSAHGLSIAPDSPPVAVARLALEAIRQADDELLQLLLAHETIRSDLEAITRGKKSFEKMVANADRLALAAIKSEIGGLDVESRALGDVTESDQKAIVFVNGKRSGADARRRFFLVKESVGWRLVPSHR